MCFSPEVDLLAGAVIIAIGTDTLRHVRRAAELPLAALPVVLGVHQLVEAFVWWGLQDRVPRAVERPAVWLFLVIAFGVVPVLVPVAVAVLEPRTARLRAGLFTATGALVALVLLYAVATGPVEASIEGHHVAYRVDLWHGHLIVALYAVATCGSLLWSEHPHVRRFGALNLVAAGLLAWLDQGAFISLWCLWAGVTSLSVAAHLRYVLPPPADQVVVGVS